MAKKRILVVHSRVTDIGGGNGVAAWTLQALREHYDLSLATLQPLDYAALRLDGRLSPRSRNTGGV